MQIRQIQTALFRHHFDLPRAHESDFYLFVLKTHYSIGEGVEDYPIYFESVYNMIYRDL